jgi:hypothetical protein
VQEGRAREDTIMLRLAAIASAAGSVVEQRPGASTACQVAPAALPKKSLAISTGNLPLPADGLRYTGPHHHLEKLQGSKEATVKERASTRESCKSGGSGHRSRKTMTPAESKPIKEVIQTVNQGECSDMIVGGQYKCDVVFPRPAVTVQVR